MMYRAAWNWPDRDWYDWFGQVIFGILVRNCVCWYSIWEIIVDKERERERDNLLSVKHRKEAHYKEQMYSQLSREIHGQKEQSHASFTDRDKVCNRVDRRPMWQVFKIYGVEGKLVGTIKTFFTRRRRQV